jgi:hypothetical protein
MPTRGGSGSVSGESWDVMATAPYADCAARHHAASSFGVISHHRSARELPM